MGDAEKGNLLERFLRLDSTHTDAEQHTMLERIFWALPPVLIAFLLTFGPILLLLDFLSGRLS
jgi:hypothetical protein